MSQLEYLPQILGEMTSAFKKNHDITKLNN